MAPGIVTFTSRGAMPQSQQQQQQQQASGGKLTAPGVLQGQLAATGNKLSPIRPGQGTPLVIGQIGMYILLLVSTTPTE